MSGGSGPELPMHVPQPNPTRLKPSASSDSCKPALARYPATDCDPGDNDVLTQGLVFSPFATALRARSPAASITLGFDVLVQEVMAAMTTSPVPTAKSELATATLGELVFESPDAIDCSNPFLTSPSRTRSCGRFGPAMEASTDARFSSSTLVNSGSAVVLSRNMPCA